MFHLISLNENETKFISQEVSPLYPSVMRLFHIKLDITLALAFTFYK